jgi:hypothetical protein
MSYCPDKDLRFSGYLMILLCNNQEDLRTTAIKIRHTVKIRENIWQTFKNYSLLKTFWRLTRLLK